MSDGVETGGLVRGLSIAASGMSAQRARMDAVARNIANADTTRTPEGGPYRRQIVVMREVPFAEALAAEGGSATALEGGVTVQEVVEDATPGSLVYDPGHPDADAAGYVLMPNVSVPEEMADLMDARNLFEANASVFIALRTMLRRATQL